jgi:hypothetical protein
MLAKACIEQIDVKGQLPKLGTVGEQNEPETVTISYLRLHSLVIKNNQSLTQQSIFFNQFDDTRGQV